MKPITCLDLSKLTNDELQRLCLDGFDVNEAIIGRVMTNQDAMQRELSLNRLYTLVDKLHAISEPRLTSWNIA